MSKLNYLDWIFAKSLWNKDKTQLPATKVEMQNQEIHRQSLPLFCSRNTKVNKKTRILTSFSLLKTKQLMHLYDYSGRVVFFV